MRNQVATVENLNNITGGVLLPFKVLGQKNSKLMDMLSQPYKDPAAAVIREYTTNALDSHVQSGQTRPVEITSPSRMYPFFSVQDFGIGLSLDEIESIYTHYVVSTKEETDDQTGNLGIGSKSGLAYVGQYTVVSVKNGQKVVGIVTRDDIGDPVMICDLSETDEPNGVKITVPVNRDFDDFNKKIKHFHQFLKPGLLLVDGEEADRSQFQSIGDNMEINYELDHDYIVMGSVAYPVDSSLYPKLHTRSIVTYVKMGEVQFPQSREELRYTVRTKAVLDGYREKFQKNIYAYMKQAIAQAPSRRVAFNLQYEFLWNASFPFDGAFEYKGKKLPDNFGRNRSECPVYSKYRWNLQYSDNYTERVTDGSFLTVVHDSFLYVTNWTNARFTKIQANKIDAYVRQNNITMPRNDVALFVGDIDPELLVGCTVIDWNEVRKLKLSTGPQKARAKHYFGISNRQYGEFVPDPNKTIWYSRRDEMTTSKHPYWPRVMNGWMDDEKIEFVFVTDRQKAKFLKDYPNAKYFRERYREEYETYLKSLTDQDYHTLRSVATVSQGKNLILDKILDPELKNAVRASQNLLTEQELATIEAYENSRSVLQKCGYFWPDEIHKKYRKPVRAGMREDLHARYPLLERIYHTPTAEVQDHLTRYVNMIYTNRGV